MSTKLKAKFSLDVVNSELKSDGQAWMIADNHGPIHLTWDNNLTKAEKVMWILDEEYIEK